MFQAPFSFNGRIRRTEYGITCLIYFVYYFILRFMAPGETALAIVGVILLVPMIWLFWAEGAKRCHDLGRSGWYQVIPFYIFVMLFQEGYPGPNEYGDDPKGNEPAFGQPGEAQDNAVGDNNDVTPAQ
jgi:uncharacterized membrane protein YhaH (DUF805 family)